jgi:putative ABC transport system ATP-binding protein
MTMVASSAMAQAGQTHISKHSKRNLENMQTSERNNAQTVLKADGLSKRVSSPEGPLTILDRVNLDVGRGESIAIVGASGAGKSTLLGLLAGLDVPSEGRIWLGDAEITALDEDGRAALRADHVGFVFQSFHLIASLTALENVMLPLELAGVDDARDAALQAIRTVGLEPRKGHYPHQLSGGEKQRVAIARAFVVQPTVLFADEPTGNLDNRTGETVIDLLFRMNAETGTTLVLVTHDLALAERCDRILFMDAGRIERESDRSTAH